MDYNEKQDASGEIIDNALESIETVLNEVEQLDSIIKENQIREFKKQWKKVFSSPVNIDPGQKIQEKEFKYQFSYLINRMNEENKIKERVIEISNNAIKELYNLWGTNR
ncbi:MAG: hypothetical protein PHO68_09530 [Lascolabacillus sp.]|uniref:hypothetical protein n=1 Tax=Lascolabacillus sp. TaxID=1924068 RepID=UPI002585EB2A|nr:hypothetical protein [Lascolabacillus sp.]MDD4759154.1 hypothetical protein [Lascolabacillus sp.]